MPSFFPTPYPDELLYSTLARYHIRSGNRNFNQTLLEVLGYPSKQLCNLELPKNLGFLVKHTPVASKYSVEGFIYNNTLYPFYKSFLIQPEAFLLKDLMRKKVGKPIFQVARIAITEKSTDKQLLRFCSHCFKEDLQKYGEAYWHRAHQVPGVLVCLTHRTPLCESLVLLQDGYLDCHAATPENCPVSGNIAICQESTLQQLLAIAKEIDWLCNSNLNFRGFQWLRKQYLHHLIEQDFASTSSSRTFKFCEDKFVDAIYSFYSQACLDLVKPDLANHAGRYFYRCLFACDIEPAIDRVAHILLIRFLLNSLKNFLEE